MDLFENPSVPRNDKIKMPAVRQRNALRMVSRCMISQSYRLLLLSSTCFCMLLCFTKRVRDVVTYLVRLKSGTIRLRRWVSSHHIQKTLFYLFIHRLGHWYAASFDDLAHRCINYPIHIYNEIFIFPKIFPRVEKATLNKANVKFLIIYICSLAVYILQSSVRNQWIFLHKLIDWDS